MSAQTIVCPSCAAALVPSRPLPAGQPLRCPRCTNAFAVPAAAAQSGKATRLADASGRAATRLVNGEPLMRVVCPACNATLKSARPLQAGKKVHCPGCATIFAVGAVAAPRRRETRLVGKQPGPRIVCPACAAALRAPGPVPPGKELRCPRCTVSFRLPAGNGSSGNAASPERRTKLVPRAESSTPRKTRLGPQQGQKTTLAPRDPRKTTLGPAQPAKTQLAPAPRPPATPAGKERESTGPLLRYHCPLCAAALRSIRPPRPGQMVNCPGCSRPFAAPDLAAWAPARTAPRAPRPPAPASAEEKRRPVPRSRPTTLRAAVEAPAPPPHRTSRYAFAALAVLGLGLLGLAVYLVAGRYWNREIPPGEWTEFVPPDGRCQVLMPGVPSGRRASAHGPGVLEARLFKVEREKEDAVFILSYSNRADDVVKKTPFEDLYTAERDYILKSRQASLTGETPLTLDGNPGKEFQAQIAGGITLVARIYLVKDQPNDRVYILLAGGKHLKPGRGDVVRFLDSFQLREPPKPKG